MVGMSNTKFGWKGTTQELKLSVKFPWISLFFMHQNKRVKQSSILRLLLFQSLPVKLTNFLINQIYLLNYQLKKKKSCGWVLTSSEALKLLREKEEKKDAVKVAGNSFRMASQP